MSPTSNVSVGVSTVAGYSTSLGAVVLAVLAYLQGDHTQQTVGVIVAGAIAAMSFAITQAGRYLQAHAQVKQQPPVVVDGNDQVHEPADGDPEAA